MPVIAGSFAPLLDSRAFHFFIAYLFTSPAQNSTHFRQIRVVPFCRCVFVTTSSCQYCSVLATMETKPLKAGDVDLAPQEMTSASVEVRLWQCQYAAGVSQFIILLFMHTRDTIATRHFLLLFVLPRISVDAQPLIITAAGIFPSHPHCRFHSIVIKVIYSLYMISPFELPTLAPQ